LVLLNAKPSILQFKSVAAESDVWQRSLGAAAAGLAGRREQGGGEREAAHRFFGRAASALEAAFAPYLPLALPPALEAMAHVGHAEVVGPFKVRVPGRAHRARRVMLRERFCWVTLRARWVTLRARWVDAASSLGGR
jgi:hypothetical protein